MESLQSSIPGESARPGSSAPDCAVHLRWALLLQDKLRQLQQQRETEEALYKQSLAENNELRKDLRAHDPGHKLLRPPDQ